MKKLLAGLLLFFMVLSAPWTVAAEKRAGHHGAKSSTSKVVKAKKSKKLKAKKQKAISAKASKSTKVSKASKRGVGKKTIAAKNKTKAKSQRLAKSSKSRKYASKRRATFVAETAPRVDTPLRQVAATTAVSTMQLDYGDALTNGELELRSAAALVVDRKTGEALYAKNASIETPIASITKLMTALVTLDAGLSMQDEIEIGLPDVDHIKGTSSRLPLGARLTRGELMSLALIASENRAAAALSRSYPGGREAFIHAMNLKAYQLGMHNTRYVDGTGLSSQNRSTAEDLARLVSAAYRYPAIRRITATGSYDVTVPGRKVVKIRENGRIKRVTREVERNVAFVNTNALTRNSEWDIGVSKTGYINEAGHCLVMQANIAQRDVIIVLLDSWGKMSRIGDATRIRKWLEQGLGGHFASRGGPQV